MWIFARWTCPVGFEGRVTFIFIRADGKKIFCFLLCHKPSCSPQHTPNLVRRARSEHPNKCPGWIRLTKSDTGLKLSDNYEVFERRSELADPSGNRKPDFTFQPWFFSLFLSLNGHRVWEWFRHARWDNFLSNITLITVILAFFCSTFDIYIFTRKFVWIRALKRFTTNLS